MKTKHLFLCLLALLGSTTLHAYDAKIGGIYYNFDYDYDYDTDEEIVTAIVTYQDGLFEPYYVADGTGGYMETGVASSDYAGSVVIPEFIPYWGKTIPVTGIGEYAFYGCSGLTSVTIPNSVTSIGQQAFYLCTSLTSVTMSENLTYICSNAFERCISLTSITIPSSVKRIENAAFAWSGLTSILIPNGVKYLGRGVFTDCGSLISVTIGEGVTNIGYGAFSNCSCLTSITIPNGVTSIGELAFSDCSGLTSVTIPNSVKRIDFGAFVSSGLTSITIPNSVTIIQPRAFANCSSLTSVTIPNSVTSIDYSTFEGCGSLTSVTIPNSVTSIGDDAFSGCSSLTSVTIGNSVTNIGYRAFEYCSGLTDVWCYAESVPSTKSDAFSNSSVSSATLHVPVASVEAYSITAPWSSFDNIVPIKDVAAVDIGSLGYATYCSTHALDFSEVTDIKAYIASGFSPSTGKLVLTRVDEVPAGEGLYLVGEEGTYEIPFTTTDMMYSNLLKGVTTATTIYPTEGDYTNFILANGSHGVGFYTLSNAGELAAGKAYLQLPTANVSNVKAISVIFDDDDPTAIQDIEDYTTAESIYNMQGQKVSTPRSGLYIINGKKVLFK